MIYTIITKNNKPKQSCNKATSNLDKKWGNIMTREQYFSKMNEAIETIIKYDNLLYVSDFNIHEVNVTEKMLNDFIQEKINKKNQIMLKFIDRNNQTINIISERYKLNYDYGIEKTVIGLLSQRTNNMIIRKVIGYIGTEQINLTIKSDEDITKLFEIIYSAHMYTIRYNNIAQQQAILNYAENELKRINEYVRLFEE